MEFRDKLKFERDLEEKKSKGIDEEKKIDFSLKKSEKINLGTGIKTNSNVANKDFKFKFSAPGGSNVTSKQNTTATATANTANQNTNNNQGSSNINLIDL
jgi:hypothetical protein